MNQRTGLYRSRTDKVLGGVAGGIAKTLNTDSSIIRLIFILLAIFAGGGVLLYLILWIVLPEDDYIYIPPQDITGGSTMASEAQPGAEPDFNPVSPPVSPRSNSSLIAGLLLIIIGGFFLIIRFIPRFDFWHLWPVALVVAGLAIILTGFSRTKKS